ncbi:hypothetical protein EMCG_03574 [[Emmonsia] crescens]|uniref:Aminoglycoside phosphotransferase domain-containing protein n=1 Tax=[Emmonsia] crescens TaxID=73230 RepID=A0A0G2HW20_9EURO|nr:hypothetical protein EMCG_03574 [Emmonsia crescens UAMH 3008]
MLYSSTDCFSTSVPAVILSSQQPLNDGHSYLKHADDKGDHILVDDDYHITVLIDWEWSYTASKAAAFKSLGRRKTLTEFYEGLSGRILWMLFTREECVICLNSAVDMILLIGRCFVGLFKGLRKALSDDGDDALEWENWREIVLRHYTDDD